MRRHMMGFQFKDETSEEAIQAVRNGYKAMQEGNPGLLHVSVDPNISRSGFKRYDWILTMDFATHASWRQYEDSEAHDRMVADNLTGSLAGITSIDYDIGDTPAE
jgi:hypothetical protein